MAAVDVFAEMGVSVTTEDFVPFMGTGKFSWNSLLNNILFGYYFDSAMMLNKLNL